jgi:hypothetical protein
MITIPGNGTIPKLTPQTPPNTGKFRHSQPVWNSSAGEFEMRPDWVPSMDEGRRSTANIFRAKTLHRFDHNANWAA